MYGHIKNIIILSIPINFIWEMLQMPLYSNMHWDLRSSLYCSVASIGDAVMILIIYFFVSFLLKNKYWILELQINSIILSILIGFVLSFMVEDMALTLNLWKYSNLMPTLINSNIGVSPILQMVILPLLVFKLTSSKILKSLNSVSF